MSPLSPSSVPPRRGDIGRRSRLLGAATSFALIGLAVGGCSASTPENWVPFEAFAPEETGPTIIEIPPLSSSEVLRDQIVRSDAVIAEAAGTLGLESAEHSANDRVLAAGSLWDPWIDVDPPEADLQGTAEPQELPYQLEQPQSLEAAPEEETDLIEYMLETAAVQLVETATTTDLTVAQRLNLASILAGRTTSAGALEAELKITAKVDVTLAQVDELTESTSDAQTPQSDAPDAVFEVEQDAEELSQATTTSKMAEALISYDCAASTLLQLSEAGAPAVSHPVRVARSLETRAMALQGLGAPDARGPRCLLDAETADQVLRELVRTDLSLATSGTQQVRELAAAYLFEDARLWGQTDPQSADQVGISTHRLENEDPEGQSGQ